MLTLCLVGTCILTILKGGGNFESPVNFECGSMGYWAVYFCSLPWVLVFALYFRHVLMQEYKEKIESDYEFLPGEVQWSPSNTLRYPAVCATSGLLAGLFGVGGGIVKGPLMLEMGVLPTVASASAATMILYTASSASLSFFIFGMLGADVSYGFALFLIGIVCTWVGQSVVTGLVTKSGRQSIVVLVIGTVIALSSVCVAALTVEDEWGKTISELFETHSVCSSDVGAGE